MSDTLTALQEANRSSSVLNAIANPPQINPLSAINAGVQAARGVTGLRTEQFNLQQSQLQPAYQSMRMLMATTPNPTDGDVNAALGGAARLGANVDGLVQNYTAWRSRGGTPADFMRATALGGMSPENQAQMGVGAPASVDTGAGTVFGMRGGSLSASPGQFQPNSFIRSTLSPAQATEFVTIPSPQGPVTVTRGSLVGMGASGAGGGSGGGPGTSASTATNNFGNIRSPTGGFASYATPQDGVAAMASNLTAYQDQHGINTLNDITARWAPKGDGANDPVAYANTISKLTGIDPNAKLDLHDPATLAKIIPAMAQVEHGRPMGVGGDVLSAGINAGLSGRPGGSVTSGPPSSSGPFIGATSAQPVGASPGGGAVRPAGGGGIQYFSPTGQPEGPGGGGGYQGPQIPGVTYTPQGPVIRPTSPYEQPQLEQSSKDYVADQVNNKTLSRRIAPLQNAISIIKENPGLVTGPSSENWYQWVQGLAAASGIDVGDVHNANAYNELAKQLAMNLQQSGADPSDMARLMHEASQPNTMQGKQAIVTLAAEQIGYQRMKSAQYLEFRSRHPADANTNAQFYNQETGDWAGQQDPMAYAADLVPQAELQAHLRGLNPDQQRAFVESLNNAKRLFKLKLPTGG